MVLVSDFALDTIQSNGEYFQLVYPRGTGSNKNGGFLIAQNGIYHLRYMPRIEPTRLESGAEIQGVSGFLISKDSETENYEVGLAFYESQPYYAYSTIPEETIVTVADAYNATIAGDEVETSESIDPQERREEEAQRQREANQERQREAQEREQEIAESEEAEAERLRLSQIPINEDEIIREEIIELEGDINFKKKYKLQILELTRGTELNPIVSYRFVVFTVHNGRDGVFERQRYKQDAGTQEQAEQIFDDYKTELPAQFEILNQENLASFQEQEARRAYLTEINTPLEKDEPYKNIEFYFKESPYSFKQMLEITGNAIEWDDMPIYQRFLGRGNFNDAVSFSNNNNTLNLDDFDAPRITTAGIQENKSGGVGFTVRRNWRMTFRLEGDSNIKMLRDSKVEGVKEVNSTTFDFTMYSGDRLEIDIDNERENLRPFLVQINGKEWYSPIEIDDEVSLTLVKAEQINVKLEVGTRTIYDERSEKENIYNVTTTYEGPAWGGRDMYYYEELEEFEKSLAGEGDTATAPSFLAVENEVSSPLGPAEASFVSPEEVSDSITEPVTDAVGDIVSGASDAVGGAVDSFFSKYRWWIIGGLAVVGLTLFALYRIRNPKVAPTQPVVVAQAPPVQASGGSE